MSILNELLEKLTKCELDEQLRIVCDTITREEILDIDGYEGPSGANVFLSLPVDFKSKVENYICLERESQGVFIISHWRCQKTSNAIPKRFDTWECKSSKTEKILAEVAQKISFLKGE